MAPNADSLEPRHAQLSSAASEGDGDCIASEPAAGVVDVKPARFDWRTLFDPSLWYFIAMHTCAAVTLYSTRPTKGLLALCFGMYVVRMWGITGGYHRYFSHRAYNTSRAFQFFLAFLGSTAIQKGVLWWASNHRHHHKFADRPEDAHSPKLKGFWWSHFGWFLCSYEHDSVRWNYIPDLARYPELVLIDRFHYIPGALVGVGLMAAGGMEAFYWGGVISTVLLWHGTFTINSLSHMYGTQRFACEHHAACTARNNFLLALVTMGEGWHSNHHAKANVAPNGFYWYEVDVTYYVLRLLALVGLVRDLRQPDLAFLEKHRSLSGPPGCSAAH